VARLLASLLFAFSSAALAQVELLYVGAADCGFCRKWEAQYLQHGKPKAKLEWTGVRFTPVDIGSSSSPEDFRATLRVALDDDGVDAVVAVFLPPLMGGSEEFGAALAAPARR